MTTNPLLQLNALGQSVWLDNLGRGMVEGGKLARLVADDGVSGVTSNPAIFQKSIAGSADYDSQIRELAGDDLDTVALFEALAIRDIRGAADVLREVYDRSEGTDGFVSLEVSPHLARDTEGTIAEATRLWGEVNRPNLLIKIPGTPEGIPAIRTALERDINVNVTLIFSLEAYREIMEAHLNALENRVQRGESPSTVASVASFFLSRIDVLVDRTIDAMVEAGDRAERARTLRGRAAVASAKLAYQQWKSIYSGPRWEALAAAGARVQKPLWASTSTKDPVYPDVKYVEPLIGPQTINTLPEVTVAAFRDHGIAALTIEDNIEEERRVMDELAELGIDMTKVTDTLLDEGIQKFNKPFDSLMESLEAKRAALGSG